jgi:hypothetical protein
VIGELRRPAPRLLPVVLSGALPQTAGPLKRELPQRVRLRAAWRFGKSGWKRGPIHGRRWPRRPPAWNDRRLTWRCCCREAMRPPRSAASALAAWAESRGIRARRTGPLRAVRLDAGPAADLLARWNLLLEQRVLAARVTWTDDTPAPVLNSLQDKPHTGRLWTYLADDAQRYSRVRLHAVAAAGPTGKVTCTRTPTRRLRWQLPRFSGASSRWPAGRISGASFLTRGTHRDEIEDRARCRWLTATRCAMPRACLRSTGSKSGCKNAATCRCPNILGVKRCGMPTTNDPPCGATWRMAA